jgi:hypothetical protein
MTIKTEVTTIAEQEAKSGQKILDMTGEELLEKTLALHPVKLAAAEKTLKKMKAKQITQAVIAALDLPKNGIPVDWVDPITGKPKPEHALTVNAFLTFQNLLASKYLVMQQMVIDNQKAAKEKETESDNTNSQSKGE